VVIRTGDLPAALHVGPAEREQLSRRESLAELIAAVPGEIIIIIIIIFCV
jgi:hypothetical protein